MEEAESKVVLLPSSVLASMLRILMKHAAVRFLRCVLARFSPGRLYGNLELS